ncbi:MAG: dihydropteroate synthase [Candidatus Omnitrophota bacterium]
MLIIGERINSSRKPIAQAISTRDSSFLINEASSQIKSGADFIDINCAVRLEKESEDLIWLMELLQSKLGMPISIDSPDAQVISRALKVHKGKPFINSITAESDKFKHISSILKNIDCFVVALTMDDKGMPHNSSERLRIARRLVDSLKNAGITPDNIYIDPLVKPISSEPDQANEFLKTVRALKKDGIKTIGGLSNVSYGLPQRRVLNAAFLSLAIEAGIDAAIIDPTEELTNKVIKKHALADEIFKIAQKALLGEDSYCMNYIKAFRAGKLNG